MPVPMNLKNNFGESGYADVRLGKASVRVMFQSGTGYEVGLDQWDAARPNGQYNLTMSKDGTKILSIRPTAGTLILQFLEIGNRINEVPEPKIQKGGPRQSKDGKKKWFQPDSLVWSAKVEVLSPGKFKGLTGTVTLPYIFSPIPNSPYTQLSGSKNELERIEVFFRVNGFDLTSVDIPFSTNVLPWLEKKFVEVRHPFLGTFDEKGFINSPAELDKSLAKEMLKDKKHK